MSVKQFDPLNIAALWDAIRRTSSLRLLVMLPSSKYPARLYAYAVRQPDAEIEYSTKENGGVVVGYYRKDVPLGRLVQDLGAALEEIG